MARCVETVGSILCAAIPAFNRFYFQCFAIGENQDVRAAMKKTRLRQDSVLERPLNQHPATVLLVRSNPVQP
jgi:hypothetical protein